MDLRGFGQQIRMKYIETDECKWGVCVREWERIYLFFDPIHFNARVLGLDRACQNMKQANANEVCVTEKEIIWFLTQYLFIWNSE